MDIRQSLFSLVALTALSGCGDTNSSDEQDGYLPALEFAHEYHLDDFSLNKDYQYLELKRSWPFSSEAFPFETLLQIEPNTYDNLSVNLQTQLSSIGSYQGFYIGCQPDTCPTFMVTVDANNTIDTVDSRAELLDLFSEIDTEAEAYLWLKYSNFKLSTEPTHYTENETGFDVLVEWDTLCGQRGTSIIQLYRDGSYEETEQVSNEFYQGCN